MKTRGCFGRVTRGYLFEAGEFEYGRSFFLFRIPFTDRRIVKQLVLQIAVPIDTEVHGRTTASYIISFAIADSAFACPRFHTPIIGVYIPGSGTAYVFAGIFSIDDLSGPGSVKVKTVFGRCFLVWCEELKPGQVGVEIRQVYGIAVTEAGTIEQRSVVVDDAGTVNDLVATVFVDITHREVMVTLAVCSLPRLGRVMQPQLRKFFPVEIICRQSCTLVIPPAHHQAGTHTVEIGNTGQITFRTVAVTVVTPTRYAPPQRTIRDTRNLGSRLTVENGQILRSGNYHTS